MGEQKSRHSAAFLLHGETLVIWRSLCYDRDGAENEMESRGDVPQSRITPLGLSNLLMGVLGADRARIAPERAAE